MPTVTTVEVNHRFCERRQIRKPMAAAAHSTSAMSIACTAVIVHWLTGCTLRN